MPSRFLSRAELDRLDSFPEAIASEQLAAYFRLDGEELAFVREQRSATSQLGIAVQLCALRWLGFVPACLTDAPAEALDCLAFQLDVPARAIFDYAVRERTGRDHRVLVRDQLGWRASGGQEIDRLRGWLVEQALERDKPTLLLERACSELRAWRVERPSLDRLVRLIAWAREHAHERTFELVSPVLTPQLEQALDELLIVGRGRSGRTPLSWLRSRPTSLSPGALRRELDKRAYLSERIGAERLDLQALPPSRRAWLAQLGRRSTNQALARMDPVRRYPVLVCFCAEMLERTTDDALEVFERALGRLDRGAQREQQDLRRRHGRQTEATVRRFIEIARIVLEAQDARTDPLRLIDRRVGLGKLRTELQEAERIVRPPGEDHLDLMLARGAGARGMLPELVAALTFHADAEPTYELLAALRLVGQLTGSKQRWLPGFSPSGFLDRHWRALVVDTSRGRLDRRAYELGVAFELRSALRSGRVWVDGSRRHADPASYLLPEDRWRQIKPQFTQSVDRPITAATRLDALAAEQAELVTALQAISAETGGEIDGGELQVTGSDRENDTSRLSELVAERLPKLELGELLVEVDGWTSFTGELTHAAGASSRTENLPRVLYAAILAQATNLGLTGMADSSDLSYDQLAWATEWYLRDETLTTASARLVDHHHALPLASSWGDGRLSSSDGQRFASSAKGPAVAALPRYFGHRRRGAQFFTWTSDQYSQYASKVVPATVRDAAHVLDGILDNQTDLEIAEHTTDTHGYTEIVFGIFDLLGLRFAPRIRDLDRQRLYHHGPNRPAGDTAELLPNRIRPDLILSSWDAMLRLAASLKHGWAPASLLLTRLQASQRANPIARALQEHGRLIKTNFILAWLADEQLRRRIGRQLNKGESLHAMRRYLCFAGEGRLRHRKAEDQSVQAQCLTLICNAIIVWNTVYTQVVLDQLRAEGQLITTADLERLSPIQHAHIRPYGRYQFNTITDPGQLRPLRQPPATRRASEQTISANRV